MPIAVNSVLASIIVLSGLTACGPKLENSATKIINGLTIDGGIFPSVVHIYDFEHDFSCTGTFVNATTVISAAHCTGGGTADRDGNVSISISIIHVTNLEAKEYTTIATSTSVVRNPKWDEDGEEVNMYDLSLITFPAGTAKAVSAIADKAPKLGDEFDIVGYGLNQSYDLSDGTSAAIKRHGTNVIEAIGEGFLAFESGNDTSNDQGANSGSSAGDSGGPMFVGNKLVGTTSGGQASDGGGWLWTSYYIDLNSKASKAFLKKHLK